MKKAWCDVCGKQLAHCEETEIGKLKMDSAYSDEFSANQIHRSLDVCRECLNFVDTLIECRIQANEPRGYRGYFEEGEF